MLNQQMKVLHRESSLVTIRKYTKFDRFFNGWMSVVNVCRAKYLALL